MHAISKRSLMVAWAVLAGGMLPAMPALAAGAPTVDGLKQSLDKLDGLVKQAQAKKIPTAYADAVFIPGKLFVAERFEKMTDQAKRDQQASFLAGKLEYETAQLQTALGGKADPRVVPPIPDYSKLVWKDHQYLTLDGKPQLFMTTGNSGGDKGDIRYFGPGNLYSIIEAVGANRYDYQETPIWKLYQSDPKSHRIYDGGWCGHIIKDKWSAGGEGGKDAVCVISLDYPPMLDAVQQAIIAKAKKFAAGKHPQTKIIAMDWEYTYNNYDEPTKVKWQSWLKEHYGTVQKLNDTWKPAKQFASFNDVTLPPIESSTEKNPAKYYDYGEFSLQRFSNYLHWAKETIAKEVPGYPMMVGGGEPFGSHFWEQSMDEEGLANLGVDDIWLSETGSRSWGTGAFMDLQHSIAPKMFIIDPEYHSTGGYAPLMFFHGCDVLDWYDVSNRIKSSVGDGYGTLHGSLDLRRLQDYIVQFPRVAPQAALLYSRASLIQQHPGTTGKNGVQTPYTIELEKCYRAGNILDTGMGFVTSKMVDDGIAKNIKVVIVPGAYFENQQVVAKIKDFVKGGGTLVVMPTSFVADEYNRRRLYLNDLGIEVTGEAVPRYLAKKAKSGLEQAGTEYDFIQGPIAPTIVEDEPTATLKWMAKSAAPGGALEGKGIRQTVKLSGEHEVLASYDDGSPAIVKTALGKGQVYYVAMQLTDASASDLLDMIYSQAGVERLARVVGPDGKKVPGVESRTIPTDGGYLTYIYNLTDKDAHVSLKPGMNVSGVENLSACTSGKIGDVMNLGPYEWVVLKLQK